MPDLAAKIQSPQNVKADEKEKERIAKEFESVFIYRLLMEMNNTVGSWGMEKEQGNEQVQSLFALCLSDGISKSGGIGLWKEIKSQLETIEKQGKSDLEIKL